MQALHLRVSSAFLISLVICCVNGCAISPTVKRGAVPAAGTPADAKVVAAKIQVTGPRGRLTPEQRERMIQRLAGQGSASLLQRQLAAMTTFGDVDLSTGNQARLLVDGPAAFEAMFGAIEKAKVSILLESYIIDDAAIAQRLSQALARKRAQGVAVAVVFDDVGSLGTDEAFFSGLRDSGVLVCAFNPVKPQHAGSRMGYWDITHRDHRKILVVDREWGFTGGINISAVYSSGSFRMRKRNADQEIERREGWRDTQVQLHGHAALLLDDLVRETWAQQSCDGRLPEVKPTGSNSRSTESRVSDTQVAGSRGAAIESRQTSAARSPAEFGHDVVRIIPVTPGDEINRVYALLLTAIDASQLSVYLTMAYFAPGPDMINALGDAARRGVDVQLILPSVSDFSPVLLAGQSYYQRLLDSGVKIHELQTAVLHAKTGVIDGVVSTVGSSNMDWRSFASNNEINAVIMGEDFGNAMVSMFRRDVDASRQVTAETWENRPLWQRIKETGAKMFEALF